MFWVLQHPKDKAEYFKDDDGNLLDPIKLPIFGFTKVDFIVCRNVFKKLRWEIKDIS